MGPDFICIGAPKTGTSWLYNNLANHPEIWVPPVKELRYFDRKFPLPKVSATQKGAKGLLGLFPDHRRELILKTLGHAILERSTHDFYWAVRYFSNAGNDNWYLSLFNPPDGMICGEFTTGYCALSKEAVQYIYDLLPNTRILFFMRDPIERAWSHAKMLLPRMSGKPINEISATEFLDYTTHKAAQLRGDYVRTLATWESVFPAEQMFIGFYDDIADKPSDLLLKIYAYLNISVDARLLPNDISDKINASSGLRAMSIPADVHRQLAVLYIPTLQVLSERFHGHTEKWLEKALEVYSQAP